MSPSGDIGNLPFDWGYDDRNVPLIWRPPQEARLGRMGMSCKELRRAGVLARVESGLLLPRNSLVSQIQPVANNGNHFNLLRPSHPRTICTACLS
jgi:hypothetical protein